MQLIIYKNVKNLRFLPPRLILRLHTEYRFSQVMRLMLLVLAEANIWQTGNAKH